MKAMILAAGLGTRMLPLTANTPKPLLRVGDRYLIELHLEKLSKAGISDVVINTHWLADQIPAALGKGEKWGLSIHYSHEPILLETAGGIRHCLDRLVDGLEDSFLLINGDIYFEWDLTQWLAEAPALNDAHEAYLALVGNPSHHPSGDFALAEDGVTLRMPDQDHASFTYAGLGLYRGSFFAHLDQGYHPLGPMLKAALKRHSVSGCLMHEYWLDVGTPERLEQLRLRLQG